MNVVAIHNLREDKESLGGKLAEALGVTPYEALSRLRIPGNGPIVVAVFADGGEAAGLVEKLRATGFQATLLSDGEIAASAGLLPVRRFGLGEETLHCESLQGGGFDISYGEIAVILRGTRMAVSVSTETVKSRSFSPGRAIISGGMMLSKTTKTTREIAHQERANFFMLYAADGHAFLFNETGLAYDSLGSARRPTSAANFSYILDELRRRCVDAVYDERLLKRPAQAALLGPRLSPEANLAVATGLLAKVLSGRA